jgi:hypothetical protein
VRCQAASARGPVVVVDNYDSFTYNLCQVGAMHGGVMRSLVEQHRLGRSTRTLGAHMHSLHDTQCMAHTSACLLEHIGGVYLNVVCIRVASHQLLLPASPHSCC